MVCPDTKCMTIRFLNPVLNLLIFLLVAYVILAVESTIIFGADGIFEDFFKENVALKIVGLLIGLAHITITAMSLSFHRHHTHGGVWISKVVDYPMQIWLWMTTSMSKLDWVSVHAYHHAYSDQPEDVHSPKQYGFWKVFFLGAFMYTKAKNQPDVLKIRRKLPQNGFEKFLAENLYLGPALWVLMLTIFFGPFYGALLSFGTFIISPLFAVGGVNAMAHCFGYRNYNTSDVSTNCGFLVPLNFIICGELDHNNHHAHPKSARFSHRWYEFDIGFVYLKMLELFGLAKIKHARAGVS